MKRALRYLRIAWTVFLGVLSVMLIALWVRSYWWADHIFCAEEELIIISSVGKFELLWDGVPIPRGRFQNWEVHHRRLIAPSRRKLWWVPTCNTNETSVVIHMPYWLPTLLVGAAVTISGLPWVHWRFSLRTLLIAITAVAVGLWFIVWMTRT